MAKKKPIISPKATKTPSKGKSTPKSKIKAPRGKKQPEIIKLTSFQRYQEIRKSVGGLKRDGVDFKGENINTVASRVFQATKLLDLRSVLVNIDVFVERFGGFGGRAKS